MNGGRLEDKPAPVAEVLAPPSAVARNACAAILIVILAVWTRVAFVKEDAVPGALAPIHDFRFPLVATAGYLVSLWLLRNWCEKNLWNQTDTKALLSTCLDIYNVFQVILNAWMVYRFVESLLFRGHPFIGDYKTINTGMALPLWVHYCDKYLEFLDTYFMVLRGKMEQVRIVLVNEVSTDSVLLS